MNKYGAKKIYVDGTKFDSQMEADFYKHLLRLKAEEKIINFELQPKYELIPKFVRNGKTYRPMVYTADFLVYHLDGNLEAIDVKGVITEATAVRIKFYRYKCSLIKLTLVRKSKGNWIDIEDKKIWGVDL